MSKVLVVDDSPTELSQIKEMLQELGHDVMTAENGIDGVKLANKEQPDIVLMVTRLVHLSRITVLTRVHLSSCCPARMVCLTGQKDG